MVLFIRLIALLFALQLLAKNEEASSSWRERGVEWGEKRSTKKDAPSLRKMSAQTFLDSKTVYGVVDLKSINARKNLTCYGSATLTNSSVTGVVTMYGIMRATGCTFNDLDVRAAEKDKHSQTTLALKYCRVANLFLEGSLKVNHVTLQSMTLLGNDAVCEDSTIRDSILVLGSAAKEKNVIYLKNTQVNGTITFAQKGGLVVCTGNSSIKGGVIGGTVEYLL